MAPSLRDDQYFTADEAAAHLRKTVEWMRNQRKARTGPPFVRVGKSPLYVRSRLDSWVESLNDDFTLAAILLGSGHHGIGILKAGVARGWPDERALAVFEASNTEPTLIRLAAHNEAQTSSEAADSGVATFAASVEKMDAGAIDSYLRDIGLMRLEP